MKYLNSDNGNRKTTVDKFIKKQINLLDYTPIPSENWSKSKSWNVISQRLKNTDKKVVIWALTMAATVSLTLAVGLELSLSHFNDSSHGKPSTALINEIQIESEQSKSKTDIVVNSINLVEAKTSNHQHLQFESSKLKSIKIFEQNNNYEYKSKFNLPKIDPYVSFGFQQDFFKPEIGIDFLIYSIQNKFKKQNVKLGVSTEFIKTTQENKHQFDAFHFANLSFEQMNTRTNKGWSIKSGILLNNSDSNLYIGNTLKLGIKRKFNKWINAGPEFIFTNQWRNIYPSITISFG